MRFALLFSPQGSQAIGMGRDLAALSPAARGVYDAADDALGWSVSDLCWDGPQAGLDDTRQTQPCLLTTSVACLRALESAFGRPLQPAFVAGHSVGEYAALVAAGVLDLGDALRLVSHRGELMASQTVDGGMLAVIGLERDVVASVAEVSDLVVANDNAPGQVVVSGSRAALAAAGDAFRGAGARRVVALNVSGPFHSPFMRPVGDALRQAFGTVVWHDAHPPLISNVTAQPVTDGSRICNLLAEQVQSPVEWVASVRRMIAEGVDTFIECGPGNALGGMVRRTAPEVRIASVADTASLAATVALLAGALTEART